MAVRYCPTMASPKPTMSRHWFSALATGIAAHGGGAIAQALGKSEDAVKANLYRMRRAISEGTPGLEGLLQN